MSKKSLSKVSPKVAIRLGRAQCVPIARARSEKRATCDKRPTDALADSLAETLNLTGPAVYACLARQIPGFKRRTLYASYPGNSELWVGFCGYARDLAGFNPESSPYACNSLSAHALGSRGLRTVSVEEIARLAVTLFWFTLLIAHGVFAPEIDLKRWETLSASSRRRAFRGLWSFLHHFASTGRGTNSTPARRAAYEIASLLVPNIARTYGKDLNAMVQFEHWQRLKLSRRRGTQKPK